MKVFLKILEYMKTEKYLLKQQMKVYDNIMIQVRTRIISRWAKNMENANTHFFLNPEKKAIFPVLSMTCNERWWNLDLFISERLCSFLSFQFHMYNTF